MTIKVGDEIETWFSGNKSGKSKVLEIQPYTGLFNKYFTHTIKLSAENTSRGYLLMSINIPQPK